VRPTRRAGTKVGLSDLRVPSGRARNHRIKATPGITGLSRPSVHSDGVVWHLKLGCDDGNIIKDPAYNGGPLSIRQATDEGNTVGSLSDEQRSLIVGTLLGDGAMRCKVNALIEINHSAEQKTYVDWKYQQLAELVGTPPKPRNGNGGRVAYRSTTRSLPVLTPYFRAFYPEGKKVVPYVTLTPLALAVWFMDDGCKSHRALYLNTQQFAYEDQMKLLELLKAQFGIDATLNRDKTYHRIRIAVGSVGRFIELIRPYLLRDFEYKLPA
jgi:LAGLIDADG DNA endonuclease family protein